MVCFFPDDNTVEIVPRSWVLGTIDEDHNCKVYYPPAGCFRGIALSKAVEKLIPPVRDWDVCDATVLAETGTVHFCD